jgi:bifunctional DNA-binding transcriptional regulator/antitoxin component of YhaV-PrlF toxin-antitoxin module
MELLTIDESGRVSLPKQVRERLENDTLTQVFLEIVEGHLVLQPIPKNQKFTMKRGY